MGLLDRFRRGAPVSVVLDPGDPSLVVVASAFDPAEADSAVLARCAASLDRPALVRHHLHGVVGRREELAALLDPSYAVVDGPDGSLLAVRTQPLSAMSLAQERTRMAGLAQRLGGAATGWDALQPTGE